MNYFFTKIFFSSVFSLFFVFCRDIFVWNDCFLLSEVINKKFIRNLVCLENKKKSEYQITFPNGISYFSAVSISNKKIPILNDFLFIDMFIGYLKLSHNEIEVISKFCFKGMNFISDLDLSYNKLKSLKNLSYSLGLNNFTSFKKLNFDYNELEDLNISFSQVFKKISHISLKGNKIKFIDENLFSQLSFLTSLNLENNFLENIKEMLLFHNQTLIFENLNLHNNKLDFIHICFFNKLTETITLDLSSNYLQNLDVKTFNYMKNLINLNLKNNFIRKLDKSIFKNLHKIQIIDLSFNKIETIPKYLFSDLIYLNFVKLNFNKIKSIETNSFINLKSIDVIDLNSNQIEKLDQVFISNSSDFFLNLRCNNIKIINNQTVHGFKYLTEIKLYSINVQLIQSYSFFSFKFTETIFFNELGVKRIEQDSFIGLDILNFLRLDSNQIYNLGKNTFRGLSMLKNLNLSRNNIVEIEDEAFNGLNSIENLYLSKNFLNKVPHELNKLITINYLDLSNNLIKRIQSNSFFYMKNLKSLILDSNQIFEIKIDGFNGLENLENLSISNNQIEIIKGNYFKNLISLKNLILKRNKIMNIDKDSFCDNIMLINLGFNSIFDFNFDMPKSLIDLNLESNEIELIDFLFFNRTKNVTNLNFANNKIHFIKGLSYVNGLKILNLENNRLTKLSKSSHENVTLQKLNLNSNQLSNLSFLDFIKLSHLLVSNNNISYFNSKIFSNNLIELDISNNPIISFETIFIDEIKYLEKINLANITAISPLFIEMFPVNDDIFGLSINLSSNIFEYFNINTDLVKFNEIIINNSSLDSYFGLESFSDVEICHLSNFKGNISPIIKMLKGNKRLLFLDLSFNNITSIDILTNFLSKPISLNLKGNYLKIVTTYHLNIMEDIQNLDFSYNCIEVFNVDFKLTPKLQFLYLQYNRIKIFKYFSHLYDIRGINLSFNQIEEIGDDDFDSNLYTLGKNLIDLSNNDLKKFNLETVFIKEKYETIAHEEEKITSLIILLNNNYLEKINKESFETYNLVELNLGFNLISEIHKDSFYLTINLEILKLNNNNLKFIDRNLFTQLNRLNYLDLSHNYFEYFDDLVFNNLFQMKYLNLSKNNLLLINQILFYNFDNLKLLNLTFNEYLVIEKKSFSRLKSITRIYLDLIHVKKFYKLIGESLKNQKHDKILEIDYYKSIRLITMDNNLIECKIVLYFLKKKILCNLESEKDFNSILQNCKNISLLNIN